MNYNATKLDTGFENLNSVLIIENLKMIDAKYLSWMISNV